MLLPPWYGGTIGIIYRQGAYHHLQPGTHETVFAGSVEDFDGREWIKVGALCLNKGRIFALEEA